MQQTDIRQLFHHRVHAARLIQIFHVGRSRRCQVAEIRRPLADRICIRNIKIEAHLMRDCRKMQHRIGRTAERHIHGQRVFDCFFGHDVAGADILFQHIHHSIARALCQTQTLRVNRRDRAVAAESHAKHFRQAVHRICRIHTRAGTAGRADFFFVNRYFFFGHFACRMSTDCLKN